MDISDIKNTYTDTLRTIGYEPVSSQLLALLRPHFTLRPSKSCASAPLCSYLYRYYYGSYYRLLPDGALAIFTGPDGRLYGFPPYCTEEKLTTYFKLQEKEFNEELGLPLNMLGADEEFVELLRNTGAFDSYDVREVPDSRDYLYDAQSLRTLAGRKFSKKRNHINRFLSIYNGRWEYRPLKPEDSAEALSFLKYWMFRKEFAGEGDGIDLTGEVFDPSVELEAEYNGIRDILSDPYMYSYARIGGIFIDGRLEAFSIGDYNPAQRIALISVEKANSTVPGLYQMINREFLNHEYPEALLVNREDDVGIEGLRRSKLSYFPTAYEHKYALAQRWPGS